MKKALVILLALTMVMSMLAVVPFGASAAEDLAIGAVEAGYAPEGTAINTAADFANMAADGKYYLAADITVDKTYEASFTGTFDGNGKTITTSVTLFENLNGTLKNLTVVGSVTVDEANFANNRNYDSNSPVAHHAALEADTTIENVCNKASMSSSKVGMAGIVGNGGADGKNGSATVLTIKNCANYGNIETTGYRRTSDVGGIIGLFFGLDGTEEPQLIIDGCVNYGNIEADGYVGGILGRNCASATITNCVNNGNVTTYTVVSGGIIGRLGENAPGDGDSKANVYVVENCTNNGEVNWPVQLEGTAHVAGISAEVGPGKIATFKNCVNNVNIAPETNKIANAAVGGIVGGGATDAVIAKLVFEGCVNKGDLALTPDGSISGYELTGGIAGHTYFAQMTIFKNCVNEGNQSGTGCVGTACIAGGMLGRTDTDVEVYNCMNTGDFDTAVVGGIVGELRGSYGKEENYIISGCGNTGDMTGSMKAAGILGSLEKKNIVVKNSFNVGNILCTALKQNTSSGYASGLVGFFYTGDTCGATIENCYVAGTINNDVTVVDADELIAESKEFTAVSSRRNTQYKFTVGTGEDAVTYYFTLPYHASSVVIDKANLTVTPTFKFPKTLNAVGDGDDVTKDEYYTFVSESGRKMFFIASEGGTLKVAGETATVGTAAQTLECIDVIVCTGVTSHTSVLITGADYHAQTHMDLKDNIVIDTIDAPDYVVGLSWTGAGDDDFKSIPAMGGTTKYSAKALENGTVAAKLNETAGEVIFFQNLDPELFDVDAYPTTDKTHAKVVADIVNGGYTNPAFDETDAAVSPETGDATIYVVVALAVSTVSLAAVAVVRKKKEN